MKQINEFNTPSLKFKAYYKDGSSPTSELLRVDAQIGIDTKIVIRGRTWGRHGCELTLFTENKKEHKRHQYDYCDHSLYQNLMAEELADDMNDLFKSMGRIDAVEPSQLYPMMKEVCQKCQSQHGNRLPDSEYKVLVSFV